MIVYLFCIINIIYSGYSLLTPIYSLLLFIFMVAPSALAFKIRFVLVWGNDKVKTLNKNNPILVEGRVATDKNFYYIKS